MTKRLIQLLTLTALATLACSSAAAAQRPPKPGDWAELQGEGSSIHFKVRRGHVRNLSVQMNVACIQDGGVPVDVAPNYTFLSPVQTRISSHNRAETGFVDGSDELQFNVNVEMRWINRNHARARIYAEAIPENAACVGETRFRDIYRAH